ncbi:PREDICTED: endoglucanase 2-like [Lupinus angustifolius]|uniref:endoglucanase 2-like n=1 Tax=Lupinus angustifolius TaxID=3871 RepID=UPI00092E96CF|nr:PREDICTED: endoglucanase 2-like [Lupinus angustifolius]
MGEKSISKGRCCSWFITIAILAIVEGAVVYTVKMMIGYSDKPIPLGIIQQNYSSALKTSMQFFNIQKSGKLVDNKIPWRGDSGLKDGIQASLDLSKGLYDAGDNMKFGFPMAFTATVLSWSILEYGDQMDRVGQLEPAQDSLKWITDFLINAHPAENTLYIQVGDPAVDHACWQRPEDMTEMRPLIQVNTSCPGSDIAAETAAAMASASLVFKKADSTYSSTLLKHAKQLFTFADKNRGSYSENIPEVATYYNSTGYGDELLWAASWLYHATGDDSYLEYVTGPNGEDYANWGSPTWFCWDSKHAATQVLLSRLSFFKGRDISNAYSSGLQNYRKTAEAVMCGLLPDSPTATKSRTESGLIWVSEWSSLQHPIASAFLAVLYSDYMLTTQTPQLKCGSDSFRPSDLRNFAKSQADYVLGKNPMKMSFLVGYGDKFPEFVHHRGASIPMDSTANCKDGFKWLDSTDPNPNVATGALVGGPFLNETFIDSRNNLMQTEPTTYNNAILVGLLSSLVTTSSAVQSFT